RARWSGMVVAGTKYHWKLRLKLSSIGRLPLFQKLTVTGAWKLAGTMVFSPKFWSLPVIGVGLSSISGSGPGVEQLEATLAGVCPGPATGSDVPAIWTIIMPASLPWS